MKNSYKLLGLEWDHLPLPKNIPEFSQVRDIQDYHMDRNLFDLEIYERAIPLTTIWSNTSLDELIAVSKMLCYCDKVYLSIDYESKTHNADIQSFYLLRILQVYAFLLSLFPPGKLVIMCSDNVRQDLNLFWEQLIKQKQ